jgi:hypothetical protein
MIHHLKGAGKMTKEEKILALLKRSDEPKTAREITDTLYGTKTHQSYVFGTLQNMALKGLIKKVGISQPFGYELASASHLASVNKAVDPPASAPVQNSVLKNEPIKMRKPIAVQDPFLKSLHEFFTYIQTNKVEIYNEFSLQHELGIYLRERYPEHKVQFERNVSYFYERADTVKKEIDIVVYNDSRGVRYAIELKAPINGQYPEQMYHFLKDIKFMEQLKELGFTHTFAVTLVGDRPFYQGSYNEGIYKYFREEHMVYGRIGKPTGITKHEESITLNGSYKVDWHDAGASRKYYIVAI